MGLIVWIFVGLIAALIVHLSFGVEYKDYTYKDFFRIIFMVFLGPMGFLLIFTGVALLLITEDNKVTRAAFPKFYEFMDKKLFTKEEKQDK